MPPIQSLQSFAQRLPKLRMYWPGVSFSQQNQQLDLVGGCNAFKSPDLELCAVFDHENPLVKERENPQ